MNFDPTKNYYGLDHSKEENVVLWNYWEFVKTLVTLSIPAIKQKEILGYGEVADEMAIDFETYYTLNIEKYKTHQLLNSNHESKLNILDKFLDDRSGNKMPEFWNNNVLDSHPDWEKVREMAKDILSSLNFQNLRIEFERSLKKSTPKEGEPLIIQGTKTLLIKENK